MRIWMRYLRTSRTRQALRHVALLLAALLLSIFAPPAPKLAALPRFFPDRAADFWQARDRASAHRLAASQAALDREYDLEGVQTAKLLPADVGSDGSFGYAMALSGNTLAVAARGAQSVYVFMRDLASGAWQQIARLSLGPQPPGYTPYAQSVAIDGDFIVVGSLEPAPSSEGAAYVYRRNRGGPNNWGLVTRLQAHDPSTYAYFGSSVAISGDTILVGAWGGGGGSIEAGAAYVFERDQGGANQWGETAKLTTSNARAWERFGQSIAIDGNRIAVGAPRAPGYNDTPGAVYIFERDTISGAWRQIVGLTASDSSADDID